MVIFVKAFRPNSEGIICKYYKGGVSVKEHGDRAQFGATTMLS